jgi:hypothetical protein
LSDVPFADARSAPVAPTGHRVPRGAAARRGGGGVAPWSLPAGRSPLGVGRTVVRASWRGPCQTPCGVLPGRCGDRCVSAVRVDSIIINLGPPAAARLKPLPVVSNNNKSGPTNTECSRGAPSCAPWSSPPGTARWAVAPLEPLERGIGATTVHTSDIAILPRYTLYDLVLR